MALDYNAYYHIAYEYHEIMNPLSLDAMREIGSHCGLSAGSKVLDVGSGKGYASLVFARSFGAHCTQVDSSEKWTKIAADLFEEAGLSEHSEIVLADAAKHHIPRSSFDVIICLGTALMFGGFDDALERLARGVKDSGAVIIGETSLRAEPPEEYAKHLEQQGWEIFTAEQLLRSIENAGLELVWSRRSTSEEWDRYMSLQWLALDDHYRRNPKSRLAKRFNEWAQDEKETYLRYQRYFIDWDVMMLKKRVK